MKNITEKVIEKKYNKVYNYQDINDWIAFGVRNRYIDLNKKDDIVKWISVLKGKMIEI